MAFASPDFVKSGEGKIYVLEWHSTCIKRVCRSTLQAETLSLQLGSEEAEHVRQFMYTLKNLDTGENESKNRTKATDHMTPLWMTDCRSLSEHLQNPAMSMVSDLRLAIDFTALRQEIWKKRDEAIGNHTYADELTSDAPTKVGWVSTGTMVADGLTKTMKSDQLEQVMREAHLRVNFLISVLRL